MSVGVMIHIFLAKYVYYPAKESSDRKSQETHILSVRYVLFAQYTYIIRKTCIIRTTYVYYQRDMHYSHTYVYYQRDMYYSHNICILSTRHVLFVRHMC